MGRWMHHKAAFLQKITEAYEQNSKLANLLLETILEILLINIK